MRTPAENSFYPLGREALWGVAVCLLAAVAGIATGLWLRYRSAESTLLRERRATVAAMSASERDHLRRQYTRFTTLDAQEQDHLRHLDAEISAAPDSHELFATLKRYREWLATISPFEQEELKKLTGQPVKKATRVQELSPLSREDAETTEEWLKACVRARMPLAPEEQLLNWGQWLLWERPSGRDWKRPPSGKSSGSGSRGLTEEDFEQLAERLSDVRRDQLAGEGSASGKRRLVATWLQRRRGTGDLRFGLATPDELVRFYTSELNEETRQRLLAMPPEQRNSALREEYRRWRTSGVSATPSSRGGTD